MISLRVLKNSDADRMLQWMKDPVVMAGLSFDGSLKTYEDCVKFIEESRSGKTDCLHRAITQEDDKYLGTVSLKQIDNNTKTAEFAIAMCRDSIGKGLGPIAIREMIFTAFEEMGLEHIFLSVLKKNTRAIKVYEKFGFIRKGEKDDKYYYEVNNSTEAKELEFQQHGDSRGHLVIIEGEKDIPFDIKRAFYIFGSEPNVVRGKHANKRSEFLLVNCAGKSKVKIDDGKGNIRFFDLNRPHIGVYIPTRLWKEMYGFSSESVLLCLSSEHYDPEEYIRDYCEYRNYLQNP